MTNADQAVREIGGRLEQVQKTSSVLGAQEGKNSLADAEGFGRMWTEKSNFYSHNHPEAIAQSQKGIAGFMKFREGYRAQNMEPPPIPPQTAQAMETILKAPVGADATPEAMAKVESDLQGLGYRNLGDALTKIAQQNEQMKWSTPNAGSAVSESTIGPRSLGTSDFMRAAKGSGWI